MLPCARLEDIAGENTDADVQDVGEGARAPEGGDEGGDGRIGDAHGVRVRVQGDAGEGRGEGERDFVGGVVGDPGEGAEASYEDADGGCNGGHS